MQKYMNKQRNLVYLYGGHMSAAKRRDDDLLFFFLILKVI